MIWNINGEIHWIRITNCSKLILRWMRIQWDWTIHTIVNRNEIEPNLISVSDKMNVNCRIIWGKTIILTYIQFHAVSLICGINIFTFILIFGISKIEIFNDETLVPKTDTSIYFSFTLDDNFTIDSWWVELIAISISQTIAVITWKKKMFAHFYNIHLK